MLIKRSFVIITVNLAMSNDTCKRVIMQFLTFHIPHMALKIFFVWFYTELSAVKLFQQF